MIKDILPTQALHATTKADILLIDDSVTDLRLLIAMMALSDLKISIALDGMRGYKQAIQLQPKLVLLDVRMPDMDGYTVCQQLKAHIATRSIPVIFLTSANDLSERLEGFRVGGVDYITKPFEVQEVLARVGVHLQRTSQPMAEISALSAIDHFTKSSNQNVVLITAAQQVLREHIASPPELEQLARLLCTNRRRLNDAFQLLCGQPVFGWLREERLRQAYLLVSQTDNPFSIISESLGYSTSSNFTKAFRLRFGLTPSDVRSHLQQCEALQHSSRVDNAAPPTTSGNQN